MISKNLNLKVYRIVVNISHTTGSPPSSGQYYKFNYDTISKRGTFQNFKTYSVK